MVCSDLANRMIERMLLSVLFENCVQMNLQGTLYAANIAMCRLQNIAEPHQYQLALSLALGIIMTVVKLKEVVEYFQLIRLALQLAQNDNVANKTEVATVELKGWLIMMLAFIVV